MEHSTSFPLPMFADLEQERNTSNIDFPDFTTPRALRRPLNPLSGFSTRGGNTVYHRLPDLDAFRLLQILPGHGEMLQFKLLVCGLSENEESYEALSYTWGMPDASSDREIEIITNGKSHSVTISGNLYIALRELRRTDTSRVVWADAICINQEDAGEKGRQVALMGKIFNNAWRVIIWLGEEIDRCSCGNTVLEKSLSSTHEAFSEICSVVNDWLNRAGQKALEATYENISQDDRTIVHHTGIEHTDIGQSAMVQFFSRRWFSRIWVLQEVVLARHAIVQLGSWRVPWEWVGLAAAIVVHKPELTLGQALLPAGAMNSYLMYRLSISQKCLPRIEFSFAQLLQATRHFQSKESKDKIYGLLGIETADSVGKQIIPDYREITTPQMVYEDIVRLMLGTNSPLTFLSGAGPLGIDDRPGPSWVPTWHAPRPWTILPTQQNLGFQCASDATMELHPFSKAGELVLKGVIIDHVVSIQESREAWSFYRRRGYMDFLRQPRWSKEAWRKCALTLTCGGDGRAYPVDDEAAQLADLATLLLSGRDHWIISDLIALRDVIEPVEDRMTQARYLREISEGGNSRRYISAVEPVHGPYRVFKAASKDFGVGPVDMKIGDKLCVLLGAGVPFLLRPKGDGYLVVGECYVYDLMHGEVLEKLAADPDGQLKAEWIKLI
ncbi:heterokaryon incompatibility protein (het-6OR allele) [Fusarium bulbicola]|nr:heterokaryon incompatibility protein (het-6OR allele) [Fusarium bulbicola]